MEEDKKLPIHYPPTVKCYLPIAILSSVIESDVSNNFWIINNFIQLFYDKVENKLEFFPFQDFLYHDQENLRVTVITDQIIELNENNLIEWIMNEINNGNYLVLYCNESCIHSARRFGKASRIHSQFLYGYNSQKKIFYSMNFLKETNDIGLLSISFDEIIHSFFDKNMSQLLKRERNKNYGVESKWKLFVLSKIRYKSTIYQNGLNREYIYQMMKQYLYGINSSNYMHYFTGKIDGVWGVKICDAIKEMINVYPRYLDKRIFCLIYEHKVIMFNRLEILSDYNIVERYRHIVAKARVLKNLCFKYNITNDKKIAIRMGELIDFIKNEECMVLSEFFLKEEKKKI